MRVSKVGELVEKIMDLMTTIEWCARRRVLDDAHSSLSKEEWRNLCRELMEVELLAADCEFPRAFEVLTALNGRLSDDAPQNFFQVESDINHVVAMIRSDAHSATFVQVPHAFRSRLNNDGPFGSQVADAFPSACTDLREAFNCIAADCNTAAVFHFMRAVEWALRALATDLGFRQLRVQKKSGKRKYVPLSHLEWEKILDQLQLKVDKRVEQMRPGKRKQAFQQFYYPSLQEIRAMRDAWRNHVMHSRSEYTADDANAIAGHVERLMTRLATRVSEP